MFILPHLKALTAGNFVSTVFKNAALDLNFASTKSLIDSTTGQNLVAFTRASIATYIDSAGTLQSAVTNLLLRSEEFDNASWGKSNITISANSVSAPNGTVTADTLTDSNDGAAAAHSVITPTQSFTSGLAYTVSIYAQAGSLDGIAFIFPSAAFTSNLNARFNISTGTIQNLDSGLTGSITAVGGGWYRCSATATATATASNTVQIRTATASSSFYQGNGTGTIFLWGAQLEQASTVGEYIPTTSATNSAPRFDHNPTTGESLGLLVEEQRTNLLLRSEEFDNATWNPPAPSIATVTPNAQIAPNGTLTADTFTTVSGTPAIFQAVACLASTAYTWSFYVKLGTMAAADFRFAVRDDTNGAFIAADIAPSITPVTTEWRRVTYTFTTPVGCVLVRPYPYRFSPATYGTTVHLWGAQLEAGAFATSYIPTTTAAATRNADVASITGANFSSWYRQDEGTVFAEWKCDPSTGSHWPNPAYFDDGTNNNYIGLQYRLPGAKTIRLNVVSGGVSSVSTTTNAYTPGQSGKTAAAFKANDFGVVLAGSTVATSATGSMPLVTTARIGFETVSSSYFNGTIKRITFWPQRLANSTLQAITQ